MKGETETRRSAVGHWPHAYLTLAVLGSLPALNWPPDAPAGQPPELHWSFVTPTRPALPQVENHTWPGNPVDRFVLARLEAEGLSAAPAADGSTLLRRVTLDLTGLPPTPGETDAYLADDTAGAYARVVDRLLASPRFGERLAIDWLDAARYADTYGYHEDYHRDMWAWRDWVIGSLNNDMPFDQFTVEQLAGDLLPNATTQQRVATAFNRLHGVTSSGIPEEFRVKYDLDRVNTTSTVWLGLTIACAQCHDHKYDPITQKEFYEFYAHFNNVDDPAIMSSLAGNVKPLVSFVLPEYKERLENHARAVADLRRRQAQRSSELSDEFSRWREEQQRTVRDEPAAAAPTAGLLNHFPLDEQSGERVTCRRTQRGFSVRSTAEGEKDYWHAGKLDGSIQLDGQTYVDLGDALDFKSREGFSFGAWVFPSDGGCVISRMDVPSGYRGWSLMSSDGKFEVRVAHQDPGDMIRLTTTSRFEPEHWHHVFVTYDGSKQARGLDVYVNGETQPAVVSHDTLTGTIQTNKPASIGRRDSGDHFKGMIDDVRVYGRALSPAEVRAIATPLDELIAALRGGKASEDDLAKLRRYFLESSDPLYRRLTGALDQLRRDEWRLRARALRTVMVMEEREEPQDTFVLTRGQYDQHGAKVSRKTPSILPPAPVGSPANRLGVARWLVQPTHPLTARVAVNRYWQMLFGTGIVATQEDFGTQGERPSHPGLLDWLAVEFVESGWKVKSLFRSIVMSSTYRQSSRATADLVERDPQNRLLARGPRHRLPAELIRDQALAVSGLLVGQIGGPSVRPYQPPGLWAESANGTYQPDSGGMLYRRSIYTYWKRSVPPPNMLTFDAPNRETCTVRRQRTNTPLMALVLMNDPTYVEAARALAERMMTAGGYLPRQRAVFGFRLATGRRPQPGELDVLLQVYEDQRLVFSEDPVAARKLLSVGESKPRSELEAMDLAAWTTVMSMILNLDETISKE